ncbi:MAG: hypothetical protein SGCHY_001799 [Lobulomycetales sp.]
MPSVIKVEVEKAQAAKAVKALELVHERSVASKEDKTQLLEQDAPYISVLIGTRELKVTSARTCPIQIPVPHAVFPDNYSVCLFVKDPQRLYKDKVSEQEIGYVKRVIGVSKLSKKFRSYEAKRILADEYDLFMADERILPLLPKSLGKTFLKRKAKVPVKVDVSKVKDLKATLDNAFLKSTYLHLGQGSCLNIKVGRIGQDSTEIVENILAAIETAGNKIPGKHANIKSVHLKLPDSIALPLYSTVAENGEEEATEAEE